MAGVRRGKCPPGNRPNLRTGLCEPSGVPIQWLNGNGDVRAGGQGLEPKRCPEGVPPRICHQPCENFVWDDELLKLWKAARTYGLSPCAFYRRAVREGKYRVVTPPPQLEPEPSGGTTQTQIFRAMWEFTRALIAAGMGCAALGGGVCVVPEAAKATLAGFLQWIFQMGNTPAGQAFQRAHDCFINGKIGCALNSTVQGLCRAGFTPEQICQELRKQGVQLPPDVPCERIVQGVCSGQLDLWQLLRTLQIKDVQLTPPDQRGRCKTGEIPIQANVPGVGNVTVCVQAGGGVGPDLRRLMPLLVTGGVFLVALMALQR